jgi:hypothetical protein
MRHASPRSVAPRASLALHSFAAPALVALAACLTGCGDDGPGATNTPPPAPGGITITAANNYVTTASSLDVDIVEVAAESNLEICWTDVAVDIQGHAVDPTKDINDVSFVRVLRSDPTDVEEILNDGTLTQEKVMGAWEVFPEGGETCAMLEDFRDISGDFAIDPEESFQVDDTFTYLLVFATGTAIGHGARTMLILEPSTDSLVTDVNALEDSSSKLVFDVELAARETVEVGAEGPWQIDWSAIRTDNHGNTLDKNAVDRLLIGFFEGKTPDDLEEGFLDLDQETPELGGATQSWEVSVDKGSLASLEGAKGRNGEPAFSGFETDKDGTWIVGAFCGLCQNPAPVFVTILDPQ